MRLMEMVEAQDRSIRWQKTGGVCNGNLVAVRGVPCLGTLGVQGDQLHTRKEYCELASLERQSQLVTSLLLG